MATRRELLARIGTGTTLLAGATGVAGASFFEDDDPAEVRVLHASPDAPAVDVFVDGSPVLEDVSFRTVSDYLELDPGSYDVAVAPAGAGVAGAVIDTSLTVESDTDYTVAAGNRLANIEPFVFVDDNDPFPPTEERLRAVHLSPDAPAVDLVATDGPGIRGEVAVVEGLSFGTASGYLDLLPTEYEFEIRPAGGDAAVASLEADFGPGETLTAFAVGLLDTEREDRAFGVVVSEDLAPIPERVGGDGRGEPGLFD